MQLSLVLRTFNSAFECLQSLIVNSNEHLGCHWQQNRYFVERKISIKPEALLYNLAPRVIKGYILNFSIDSVPNR